MATGGRRPGVVTCVETLRDAYSRVVRAHEALLDGDDQFAAQVLDDLAADLWRAIEEGERA